MLCVGGRLANPKLPFEIKHPVILPSKHDLTDLIVHSFHSDQSGHQGVNAIKQFDEAVLGGQTQSHCEAGD